MTNDPKKSPEPFPWRKPPQAKAVGDELFGSDLSELDAFGPSDAPPPDAATSVVTTGDLARLALGEAIQKAKAAGVSLATTLIEPLPHGLSASLEFINAERRPVVVLKSVMILGRAEGAADVLIQGDAKISRQHAALIFARNDFYLEDLSSSNGTYVNGKLIQCVKLSSGDELSLGDCRMRLRVQRR